MRNFLVVLILIFITSCARNVEPTVENINKIFASQDFTFEFHPIGATKKSISFRDDYLVYKSDDPTLRREITYDEVLLINDFIQKIVNVHQDDKDTESSSFYVVKNTAYKTTIIPKQEGYYFEALLRTLKLNN
ncbi:hypothetical protein D1818_13770 [Aquimarina sp. BL5]|uniref:hypothetical protein n=1 Tax=Aquimarina sp. BL5 TaxID=1714860 RepID=UPI000E557176|nr:hypothetical protein [Aquimarina sp. BL5]AXT51859.1 hypothetical protein D1818_13770 [Aquimarina sp. BL5]RKM99830.1 hypothetical protein D7036_19765 [Aquimarina sp. BL5]